MKDVLNFTDSELSSRFCVRTKPQVNLIITQLRKKLRHKCAIQGARLIWKQKIWLAICELLCSLTNQNACFITFFCIQLPLFCTVLRKNYTVLSQSESSNFSSWTAQFHLVPPVCTSRVLLMYNVRMTAGGTVRFKMSKNPHQTLQ